MGCRERPGECPTWRHVERRAATEIGSDGFLGSKTKVRELHGPTLIGDQNVLGLQIPVVDPDGMAVLYSIQDLKEGLLDQVVVPNVIPTFRDAGEQVTLGTVLQHDKGAVLRIHDLDQGNHIGMLAGQMMELYLSLLKPSLPGVQSSLVESLDRVGTVVVGDVDGSVDNSISTHSDDTGQLEATGQDLAQSVRLSTCSGFWRRRRCRYHSNKRRDREREGGEERGREKERKSHSRASSNPVGGNCFLLASNIKELGPARAR